ncbi:hypothetical protein FRC08_005177 [Ceratobasidium sp. 394]|nr:hypothetical protein FRC08_005177 [Ceratobasidium sp. 394]
METTDSTSQTSELLFATQAARILEIRDLICESVVTLDDAPKPTFTPYDIRRATLASLSRTNHDFFFSAARVLWGTQEILLEYLLALLPQPFENSSAPSSGKGLCVKPNTTLTPSSQSNTPNLPSENSLDRFNIYAPYTKHLMLRCLGFTPAHQQGLDAIRSYTRTHTRTLNLVSVSSKHPYFCVWPSLSDSENCKYLLLDWLEVLISPSLRRLDLVEDDFLDGYSEHNRFGGLITASAQNCPNLNYLSFRYSIAFTPRQLSTSVTKLYKIAPKNIQHLQCHNVQPCPELFDWLARMTKLRRLELQKLRAYGTSQANGPPFHKCLALPELQYLILKQFPLYSALNLCQTSLISHLTQLEIHFHSYDGWNHQTISSFFQQLSQYCCNIAELTLDCFDLPAWHNFPSTNISLLRDLPLQTLSIRGEHQSLMSNELGCVREILETWPSLLTLDLSVLVADLRALQHVLPLCNQLSSLRLCIRIEEILGEISATTPPQALESRSGHAHGPLRLVSSYCWPDFWCRIPELDGLARRLSSVRPNIIYCVSDDRQQPWRFYRYPWVTHLNSRLKIQDERLNRRER